NLMLQVSPEQIGDELPLFGPKVFSILTTSSSASMESRPSPSGPKSGSSSPICSGVTCSIKFLTSISLIWARKSGSDINERGFCRKLRVRSNVQNAKKTIETLRCPETFGSRRSATTLRQLHLIGFVARRGYGTWLGRR